MTHPLHRLGFKSNYAQNSAAKRLLFKDEGFYGMLHQRKTLSCRTTIKHYALRYTLNMNLVALDLEGKMTAAYRYGQH